MGDKIGFCVTVLFTVCLSSAAANYRSDGGFMPSTVYQRTEDQLAEPSARVDKNSREERDNQPDRTQRFGITNFGNGSPYGGTAPGIYGPVKIDLGGVLLGSLLGFGAVVILPKIIHAFSYSYGGGYGRSAETDLHVVSDMLGKLDETLSKYNIDSTACMQRLSCSYVQLANENMVNGNASDFDVMLASLSNNSLVRRMMDGTSIFEALSAGKSLDTDCETLYPKCKLDKKTVIKIMSQLIPA
ncbi:unnamed protein product [Parnassius mnemosyne]|uniref:Uncharacterized protein n=2 Tax=Parnassius mnemosyne TaxID=213953 RepID=A0AAV1KLB0_9NEOP